MEFEVGEFYLNASGEVIKITSFRDNEVFDCNRNPYSKYSGRYSPKTMAADLSKYDLIVHIPNELHFHICQMIATYHTEPNYAEKVNLTFEIFNMKSQEQEANKIVDELVEELERGNR